MLLRYFVVDGSNQFRRVDRDVVEEVWNEQRLTDDLDWPIGDELRIVTVLCDEESLAPQVSFFLRTELVGGEITEESRNEAYEAMSRHQGRRYGSRAAHHQLAGWPQDWQRQLAVALDVLPGELRRIGIGGPLLMADLWGFSIERILDYFEQATGE